MLTSISDYHIFYKFKKTRSQVFKEYIKVVEAALDARHRAPVPLRGRDEGGHLRLLRALCAGAHVAVRGGEDTHKDTPLRHPGSSASLTPALPCPAPWGRSSGP